MILKFRSRVSDHSVTSPDSQFPRPALALAVVFLLVAGMAQAATGGHERQVNYIRLAGSLIAKQIWDSDFTENTTTTTARAPGELDFNPFRKPYENATVVDCNANGAENGNGVGNGNGQGQGCGNAGGNGNGNDGGATDPSAARVVTTSIKYWTGLVDGQTAATSFLRTRWSRFLARTASAGGLRGWGRMESRRDWV